MLKMPRGSMEHGACNPSDGDEVEEGGGDVIALCVDVATFFATFQK